MKRFTAEGAKGSHVFVAWGCILLHFRYGRCVASLSLPRRGITLTPVSSTGQALALSHDGRGERWESRFCDILGHFGTFPYGHRTHRRERRGGLSKVRSW